MKSSQAFVSLALLVALALGSPSASGADGNPPDRLTYQGYLVDGNGTVLAPTSPKNYDVIFRVYGLQSGGNSLWTEQQTVTVDKGNFSVLMGEGSVYNNETHPLLSTLFAAPDASDRFVEITVRGIGTAGGDVTIAPRLRLLSSPYAFLAKNAQYASSLVNNTNYQVMSVSSTNIGINKATPGSALDVNGTVAATGLSVTGSGSITGTLAIGKPTPATTLDVNGTVTATNFAGPGTIPIGGIIMWSGTVAQIPDGWAICDGTANSGKATPDLRGRFVLGAGSGTSLQPRTVGQIGGEETHALSIAEMPAHSHGVTASASGGDHTHGYYSGWGSSAGISGGSFNPGEIGYVGTYNTTAGSGAHTHTITVNIQTNGTGTAHNTMPPFYVLAYIMRVK